MPDSIKDSGDKTENNEDDGNVLGTRLCVPAAATGPHLEALAAIGAHLY